MPWRVETHAGAAGDLHHMALPARRGIWAFSAEAPTLVLGSTQSSGVLDSDRVARSGVAVARRRSGGGIVGLVPGGSLWVDVVVPVDDPLWNPDVGRSFEWLGQVWCDTVVSFGLAAVMAAEPARDRPWADLVCFAGHNTGEVLSGAAKVVGLSQRRSREMARFQCLALVDPALDLVIDHLALTADARQTLAADAATMTAAIPASPDALLAAFVARLP